MTFDVLTSMQYTIRGAAIRKNFEGRFQRMLAENTLMNIERLDKIESEAWKNAVHAAYFRFLLSNRGEKELLAKAICLRTMYEKRERLLPLQLAVWKAQCILEMPLGMTYLDSIEWAQVGWKMLKSDQAESSAMTIVTLAVWPFLD